MPQTFDISQTPQGTPPPSSSGPTSRGTGTVVDDYARTVLWIALFFAGVLLVYLGWGLFGNVWTSPNFAHFDAATQARHMSNIALVINLLKATSIVSII